MRQILAGFTSFSASRELALNLQPSSDPGEVARLLEASAEARRLLATEPGFTIGGALDVSAAAKLAAIGKVLDPPVLVDIQNTLAAARSLRDALNRRRQEFPRLWSAAEGIVVLPDIENSIATCISSSGEVLDSASERLARLRQQLREKRQELMNRLDGIVKSPRSQRFIQEPLVTEREGRYVIPVKSEMRREVKGIVHDMSNTGATVFIEPWATVEMGNEVRQTVNEEKQEVERILSTLSQQVGACAPDIAGDVALVAGIDLVLAKARYAARANATEPGIATARVLRLLNARHPLLKGNAVPLSVEIGRDFSVMVITGPNTGGKTVALKTIGLLTLMAQSGIPVPAAPESTIPVFDQVFADIGDEQSIEQTLSTFSWHIGNIVRVMRSATDKSLVLLDELGTSTDPNEGSALARSILLHFLCRGALTVATSHFSELKAFAHTTPGLQNASMDFDPATLAPTYHMTVGIPGGSNALAIAAQLGLDPEIIDRAKGMLGRGTEDIEKLLAGIMTEKRKLEALRRDLEKEKGRAKELASGLESEKRQLAEEKARVIAETRDRLVMEAAELQRAIREAAAELKRARVKENIEKARRVLTATREQLATETWRASPADDANRIAVGDTVRVTGTALQGKVISLAQDGQLEVEAGATRLKLNPESVEKTVAATSPPAVPLVRTTLSRKVASLELDLRGKRADEVEPLLDAYLNDASVSGLAQVRIIHGFGTGTVRQIVREMLASHPLVKSFRSGGAGEGGDGVTVVKL